MDLGVLAFAIPKILILGLLFMMWRSASRAAAEVRAKKDRGDG